MPGATGECDRTRHDQSCQALMASVLMAADGFSDPRRVVLRKLEVSAAGVQIQFELAARSCTIVNFSLA